LTSFVRLTHFRKSDLVCCVQSIFPRSVGLTVAM
jgi:hypothetical protein